MSNPYMSKNFRSPLWKNHQPNRDREPLKKSLPARETLITQVKLNVS